MPKESDKKLINRIADKIKKEEPIYISLPDKGILHMEHPVPFLMVYRKPKEGKDRFTSTLGKTESSYLIISEDKNGLLQEIIPAIASGIADKFKGFLIVEIWLSDSADKAPFTIHLHQKSGKVVAKKLEEELNKIYISGVAKTASLKSGITSVTPSGQPLLYPIEDATQKEITLLGIEIAPVYIDKETGLPYPLMLREIRSKFSMALRKSFFEFIRLHTNYNASNFQMLGTTTLNERVFEIDHDLAAYTKLFNFLFLVTPINADQAWQEFVKSGYSKNPVFHYRPMPVDPEIIKRKLYNLPIEEISDPTLAFLFRDKRKEMDRMMNMMQEREKPDFLLSSLQLFGPVTDQLLEVARALLVAIPETEETVHEEELVDAPALAQMAEEELRWLKKQYAEVATSVRVADDVEGILVSKGILNINSEYKVSQKRAFPLMQHEVGTHVVTYYNGKAQPLQLFSIGVPGYEELQEGLAVLAEYLCGGLTPNRMRTLAARVISVHEMITGKKFTETYHYLVEKYNFKPAGAFNIVMRVYRGGGLTKDAVYLKGLLNIIGYIQKGKNLNQLLIGKIRQDYLPVVQELIHRKILREVPITPRFLLEPDTEKIESIRKGGNIFSMIQG